MAEDHILESIMSLRTRKPTTAGPWVLLSDGRRGRFYYHAPCDGFDPPLAAVVGPAGWAVFDEHGVTVWDGTVLYGTPPETLDQQWADMILRAMNVGMAP